MISAGIWWSPSEQTTKFRGVIAFEVQEYQVELVANLGICFAFFLFLRTCPSTFDEKLMFKDPTNSNNLKVHISFCCPVANKGLSGKKKVNSVFTEELNQLLIN